MPEDPDPNVTVKLTIFENKVFTNSILSVYNILYNIEVIFISPDMPSLHARLILNLSLKILGYLPGVSLREAYISISPGQGGCAGGAHIVVDSEEGRRIPGRPFCLTQRARVTT
jgi:hypothetical protein